jgi:hypothetical protein
MTVNFGRAANLIGSGRQTIVDWASDGVLPIDHRSSVKSLDFCGLLCAAVIRDLRSRGVDLPAIRPITRFICEVGEDVLLTEIRRGNSILMWSAGDEMPMLVRSTRRITNRDLSNVTVTIDLAAAFKRTREALSRTKPPELVLT